MKIQLRIEYLDGGKTKITNTAGNIWALRQYMKKVNPQKVKNSAYYVYPLKDHEPLTLIQNNEINQEKMDHFMGMD